VAAGAVAGGIAAFLIGRFTGGSESPPPNTAPLAPSERVGLALAGSFLFATNPSGHIIRLNTSNLESSGTVRDPAKPRSVVTSGDTLIVADDLTVTGFLPSTLRAVGAVDFARALIAWAPGSPLVAAAPTGDGRGRLCIISASGLQPCAELGFEPAGLGVAPPRQVFVANEGSGAVVPFRIGDSGLAAGRTIAVGQKPHGTLRVFQGKLYVPLAASIRIVDLSTLRPTARIALPGRPESTWIAASTGRLFAAVPTRDEVAVIDTASPSAAPTVVAARRPAALTGPTDAQDSGDVYAANVGDGTIARLDPTSGNVLDTVETAGLEKGVAPRPTRASTVTLRGRPSQLTATIGFDPGKLDPTSVVVRDGNLSDGSATVEMWQGGIESTVTLKEAQGLTLWVATEPGRLTILLSAEPGKFGRVTARSGSGGRRAVLQIAKAG
jgi:hypothetical protein